MHEHPAVTGKFLYFCCGAFDCHGPFAYNQFHHFTSDYYSGALRRERARQS